MGKSAIHLQADGFSVMLDCGVKLTDPPTYPNLPEKVDAMLLSHAHLDHSGMIPALYKKHRLPVYGTDLTLELSHLLQHDSLKVNSLRGYLSPYSDKDVDRAQSSEVPLKYNTRRRIGGNVVVEFFDAGHIPGSGGILLEIDGKRVFYTGDIKLTDTRLLKAGIVSNADILVTEATYGNRNHPDRAKTEKEFLGAIESTLDGGGVALVPAFAVGRSQEVLLALEDVTPVYLDGMCKTVSRILFDYPEYLKEPKRLGKVVNNAVWIRHEGERRDIVNEPCVIVTTSGMLDGGPVLDYLRLLRKNPKNSVLLTGYQAEGSNGRSLMEKGFVVDEFSNRSMKVSCGVKQFDFSAHADQSSLIEMAHKVGPESVVTVHGDPDSCEILGGLLGGEYSVYAPSIGETIAFD